MHTYVRMYIYPANEHILTLVIINVICMQLHTKWYERHTYVSHDLPTYVHEHTYSKLGTAKFNVSRWFIEVALNLSEFTTKLLYM